LICLNLKIRRAKRKDSRTPITNARHLYTLTEEAVPVQEHQRLSNDFSNDVTNLQHGAQLRVARKTLCIISTKALPLRVIRVFGCETANA
jgi:hypothetical protein